MSRIALCALILAAVAVALVAAIRLQADRQAHELAMLAATSPRSMLELTLDYRASRSVASASGSSAWLGAAGVLLGLAVAGIAGGLLWLWRRYNESVAERERQHRLNLSAERRSRQPQAMPTLSAVPQMERRE